MAGYKLTVKAAADFARIYEYGIDTFGYGQAEQYIQDMENRFNAIANNPLLYPAVDDILTGCRRTICGVHSIYYHQRIGYIEIIRILNRQDLRKSINEYQDAGD